MSEQTLQAMTVVAGVFAAVFAFRALYVMALYRSWTLAELLGMQDDGWESERMKKNRRTFWR